MSRCGAGAGSWVRRRITLCVRPSLKEGCRIRPCVSHLPLLASLPSNRPSCHPSMCELTFFSHTQLPMHLSVCLCPPVRACVSESVCVCVCETSRGDSWVQRLLGLRLCAAADDVWWYWRCSSLSYTLSFCVRTRIRPVQLKESNHRLSCSQTLLGRVLQIMRRQQTSSFIMCALSRGRSGSDCLTANVRMLKDTQTSTCKHTSIMRKPFP